MRKKTFSEDLQSRTLYLVRLPAILLVLFTHIVGYRSGEISSFADTAPVYYQVNKFFSHLFTGTGPQIFFLISGYYFFYHTSFSKKTYSEKLKRRITTLVIPFFIWNGLRLCVMLSSLLIPQLSSVSICCPDEDVTLKFILSAFWNFKDTTYPIVVPLWFIRDLIVLSILSPLVYFFVKYLKIWGIAVLALVWASNAIQPLMDTIPMNCASVLFFTAGAYFSINRRVIVSDLYKIRHIAWLWIPLALMDMLSVYVIPVRIMRNLESICAVIGIISICADYVSLREVKHIMSIPVFVSFVYLIHEPWLLLPCGRVASGILPGIGSVSLIAGYFLDIVLIIISSMLLYMFLTKYFARFSSVLIGRQVPVGK